MKPLAAVDSATGPWALAHRGDHRDYPTNTLDAFAAALRSGADGIETDIRLTRDGELVLYHDRVAPSGTEVAQLTAAELERATGYRVPRLGPTLEQFSAPIWNLEIKTPQAAVAALPEIASFASSRRILVSSFWHPLLDAFAPLAVDTALLLASRPHDLDALLALRRANRADAIVWDYEMLDEEMVSAAHSAGLYSLAYGMETPDEHRRCFQLAGHGLVGAITDHLDRFLGLRPPARSGGLPAVG